MSETVIREINQFIGRLSYAQHPAVILIDERVEAVDMKTRKIIADLLKELSEKGHTIIVGTQDTTMTEQTDHGNNLYAIVENHLPQA